MYTKKQKTKNQLATIIKTTTTTKQNRKDKITVVTWLLSSSATDDATHTANANLYSVTIAIQSNNVPTICTTNECATK